MILPWLLISGVIILFGIGYVVFSLISMIRNLESDFGKLLIFIVLGIFILPGKFKCRGLIMWFFIIIFIYFFIFVKVLVFILGLEFYHYIKIFEIKIKGY